MEKGRVRKGKRARITQEGRTIIATKALAYPRIPRTELAEQLQGEFEREGHGVPTIETLERQISWYRNHAQDDPQDKPWSIATLDKFPIPTEALPIVLWVWFRQQERGYPLSIREAKWIARLYPFYGDLSQSDKLRWDLETDAKKWADIELVAEAIGHTLDWRALQIRLYERLTNQKVAPELKAKLLSAPKAWPQEKRRLVMQR